MTNQVIEELCVIRSGTNFGIIATYDDGLEDRVGDWEYGSFSDALEAAHTMNDRSVNHAFITWERGADDVTSPFWTNTELVDLLLQKVIDQKSQTVVAQELAISASYLSDMLLGKRNISATVAEQLGFERVVLFRKKDVS